MIELGEKILKIDRELNGMFYFFNEAFLFPYPCLFLLGKISFKALFLNLATLKGCRYRRTFLVRSLHSVYIHSYIR